MEKRTRIEKIMDEHAKDAIQRLENDKAVMRRFLGTDQPWKRRRAWTEPMEASYFKAAIVVAASLLVGIGIGFTVSPERSEGGIEPSDLANRDASHEEMNQHGVGPGKDQGAGIEPAVLVAEASGRLEGEETDPPRKVYILGWQEVAPLRTKSGQAASIVLGGNAIQNSAQDSIPFELSGQRFRYRLPLQIFIPGLSDVMRNWEGVEVASGYCLRFRVPEASTFCFGDASMLGEISKDAESIKPEPLDGKVAYIVERDGESCSVTVEMLEGDDVRSIKEWTFGCKGESLAGAFLLPEKLVYTPIVMQKEVVE